MDIRSLRKEKGLTQEKLADMIHVDQTAISQWERGITQPKLNNGLQLARIFHCKVEDIFTAPKERNLKMTEQKGLVAMKKSEFIPILACALQSADPRITGVEIDHLNPKKVTVLIDDEYSLKININGLSLLHVLGYVPWVVANNLGERSLPAIKSKISRHGIQFDGEWYWSEPLLMHYGQTVWIKQDFRADTIEIYDSAEKLIETFRLS